LLKFFHGDHAIDRRASWRARNDVFASLFIHTSRRVVAESVELAPMGIAYETRTVIEAVSADPAGYGASALDAIDVRASGMVALSMRQHRLHRRYRAARGTRLTGVVEAMAVRQERFEAAATGL
jgi:hypothetical protein